jgi:hypothetical protein
MANRYEHEPSSDAFGSHQMIAARCCNAEQVLDVGCWSGLMGPLLLAMGVRAVDGIEIDSVAAARAATQYRKVWQADIEVFDIPADCYYDRIICADGLLLVSIPNVAHWSLRVKLALGHWDYTDRGLLDRTHLHFFTLRSAKMEIEAAGYGVQDVAISPLVPFIRSRRVAAIVGRIWPTGFAYQFVIAARA